MWRIVQSADSWEQARVDGLAKAAKAESGAEIYETAVLYGEMDGVYLALQGEDRKKYGPSKERNSPLHFPVVDYIIKLYRGFVK